MAKTALLVCDLQQGVLSSIPTLPADYLARAAATIQAARSAGAQIIYIAIGFRPGHADLSPRNKVRAYVAGKPTHFVTGDASAAIDPLVAPVAQSESGGDMIVTKRRFSAFADTELQLVLRSLGITDLVLFGVVTSGVVLSTARAAGDLDYTVTVLEDLCADRDAEVHEVLVRKVLPMQADVVTAEAWLAGLKA